MRALRLFGDRKLEISEIDPPAPPAPGQVQVRTHAVALNHIDVWGWRGMAFVRRRLPIIAGAEAGGTITSVGSDVHDLHPGQMVSLYGARTCGKCTPCREGRDNFCDASGTSGNIHGFHIDGFAREVINVPARLAVPAPPGLDPITASLAGITFGTPEHMLFDNARLAAGETVLVHAGGSGIGSAAIQLAKAAGARVITTVGSEDKARRAEALGADLAVNYREQSFERAARAFIDKRGVDVVFEHVGPDTFPGSMAVLRRGGRLVTCGSTTGIASKINLFTLYQQQLRLFGSFGCTMSNMRSVLAKLGSGEVSPVIDSVLPLDRLEEGLKRLESRQVFGKIVITF